MAVKIIIGIILSINFLLMLRLDSELRNSDTHME